MSDFFDRLLDWLTGHIRLLGILAIAVSLVTWWIDLSGLVYECIYCRSQRTAIGLVGLLMLLPDPRHWVVRYTAVAICFFGADIAVDQMFLVIRNINAGRPFGLLNAIMSTGALFALVGQAMLLFTKKPAADHGT
jgi:hypothetical protein